MEEEQERSAPSAVITTQNNADLHPFLFKSVYDQQNDRLKFLVHVNNLVEELSEAEQATAKSLNRTGSSFMQGRNEQIAVLNGTLEELLKFITQFEGRAHVQVANAVANVFSKALPEYGKVSKKKLTSIWQRIVSKLEDLKKAKTAHYRNVENYMRMVKETEELIRLRDSSEELNERLAEGERETTINRDGGDEKDKFNLGFSKMLSKISASDKKPPERITELLRDIPVEERQLAANSKRLVTIRHELLIDIARGYTDIFNIEIGRIRVFKDAFANVFDAYDSFNKRTADGAEQLTQQIIAMQFETILQLPTESKNMSDCHALTFLQTDEWAQDFGDSHAGLPAIAVKIERYVELFEMSISCMQRTYQLFNEVSDVERSRSRIFRRLLDKFDSLTTGDLLSSEAHAEEYPAKLNKIFTGEVNELLPFRQGTASLVLCVRQLGEVSVRSTEHCNESVCRQLEIVQKRSAIYRKDLRDGYLAFVKQLEVTYSNVAKCRGKLSKTRATLKERYATIRQAKTTAGIDTTDGVISSPDMSIGKSFAGTGDDDNSTMAQAAPTALMTTTTTVDQSNHSGTSTTTVTGSLSAIAAAGTAGTSSSSVLGSESNSLYRMSTMKNIQNLGSTFRTASKLKQVVGLETVTDRITRIENQILTLEKEERELTIQTQRALEDMSHFLSTSSTDLINRLMLAKEGLMTELENFRRILSSIMDWNKEKSSMIYSSLVIMKRCLDEYGGIDIEQPFNLTVVSDKFIIPEVDVFEPLRSEALDEERKNVRIHQLAHLSPTEPSSQGGDHSRRPSYTIEAEPQAQHESEHDHQLRLAAIMREEEEEEDATNMPHGSLVNEGVGEGDAEVEEGRPSTEAKYSNLTSPVNEAMDASIPSSPLGTGNFLIKSKLGVSDDVVIDDNDDHTAATAIATAAANGGGILAVSSLSSDSASTKLNRTIVTTTKSVTITRAAPPPYPLPTGNTPAKVSSFDMELKKFGLDNTDKILESFSCAIYPKKGMLTHGRLFVTQHFIAFSGWPETRILLPLYRVVKLEKALTLKYIPNAITVVVQDDPEEYFFASFIDRDQCFSLIKSLSEIEKRIAEINTGEGIAIEERRLEYGYQTTSSLFAAQWTGTQQPSIATPNANPASALAHEHDLMMATPPRTFASHLIESSGIKPTFSEDDNESDGGDNNDDYNDKDALVSSVPRPLTLSTVAQAPAPILQVDMAKLNKVRNLFKDYKISPLAATKTVPFTAQAFYRSNFLHCQSYR